MDDLERRLRANLREPDPDVPAAVDAAVLAAGRAAAQGFRRRRRKLVLLRNGGLLAAAAAVLVTAWAGLQDEATDARRFDVADAWRVAIGRERDARFDQNGDGQVDPADVPAMLQRIVALEPRRGS